MGCHGAVVGSLGNDLLRQHLVGTIPVGAGLLRQGRRTGKLRRVPASKAISTTLPVSSAATVTPCTAVSVPTALKLVSHDSALAMAVVTGSGGGTNFLPWSIIALIWTILITASRAMSRTRPRTATMMRFFMAERLR
jgi:hypothetical protein